MTDCNLTLLTCHPERSEGSSPGMTAACMSYRRTEARSFPAFAGTAPLLRMTKREKVR